MLRIVATLELISVSGVAVKVNVPAGLVGTAFSTTTYILTTDTIY